MRVAVSARIIDRNVGGNSRYARAVYENPVGFEPRFLRPKGSRSTLAYALNESFIWPVSTQADVLHFPADTGALIRGRVPIVTTIHGLGYKHAIGIRNPRAQFVWRNRVAASARVSEKVITVSHSSAADIIDEFKLAEDKVVVIPHGVHEKFSPGETTASERAALGELGFPEQYMLYVGNIEPRKNIPALVDAAEKTYSDTGTKLVICGAPAWDFDDIIKRIEQSDAVVYAGRLPEELLVPAYRGAELFCFPSRYEGFGLPVLEAMAAGTPVACTRTGSLHEVADGATFEIEDTGVEAIAAAITGAMTDARARQEMSALGLQRAAEFSWQASFEKHAEVFRGLV